jgi:hypothetical protein
MVEIFGKNYYINIDAVTEKCKTGNLTKNEDGGESFEINIFQYEIIKMCLDRLLNDVEDVDEELGAFGQTDTTVSFKIAFNTLIKNNILIEDDE